MESIEQIYSFIKLLQSKINPNDKEKTQQSLINFYFEIHNNPNLSFSTKRIQSELILEQILYSLTENQIIH